jgi:hypothetical protein
MKSAQLNAACEHLEKRFKATKSFHALEQLKAARKQALKAENREAKKGRQH